MKANKGEKISWSGHGEDVVLRRALSGASGFYVDVGANDPVRGSNTYLFYEAGWRGLVIEPNPELARRHREKRPRDIVLNVALGRREGEATFYYFPDSPGWSTLSEEAAKSMLAQGSRCVKSQVRVMTLDQVLAEARPSGVVDFISIDVEGYEREVLAGLSLSRWDIKCLCIEAVEPTTGARRHEEWDSFLTEAGYSEVMFDGLNRFYVCCTWPELRDQEWSPFSPTDGYIPFSSLGHRGLGRTALWVARRIQAAIDLFRPLLRAR